MKKFHQNNLRTAIQRFRSGSVDRDVIQPLIEEFEDVLCQKYHEECDEKGTMTEEQICDSRSNGNAFDWCVDKLEQLLCL